MGAKPRTLVIDDDAAFTEQLARSAAEQGWALSVFSAPEEAFVCLAGERFDLIALAGRRPAAHTRYLARRFSEAAPDVPLMVFGAGDTTAERVAAADGGATLYVPGRPEADLLVGQWNEAIRQTADRPSVLLIDRDAAFRTRMSASLEVAGLDVIELTSASSVFDTLESAAPRALFMGRNLSGTGPIALVRAIRASGRWAGLPIIIFVGRRDRPFESQAYRSGADAVLPKEVTAEDLAARLAGLMSRRTSVLDPNGTLVMPLIGSPFPQTGRTTPSRSEPVDTPQMNQDAARDVPDVILVQDDPMFLEILEYTMGSRSYRMKAFADGWHAHSWLTALETRGKRPVVLMEPELPGVECHQLLRDRGSYGTDDLQFVILSVDRSEASQLLAYRSGATDYIVKPACLPVILAKVQRLMAMEAKR